IRGLGLEEFGLRWRHAPIALANPTPDGGCAVLSTDVDETAASLDNYAPGDGAAWRALYARWQRVGRRLVEALLTPFPAVVAGRLEARGGRVVCSTAVTSIEVRGWRAVAVRTEHGDEIGVARAVLADVGAPALYGSLVRHEHLPARVLEGMRGFAYDHATVKIDWALDGPVPWSAEPARRAGTVHLGDSPDHLSEVAAQLATRRIPAKPFVLVGQMTTSDPTRSPPGTESVWGYTPVPHRPPAP